MPFEMFAQKPAVKVARQEVALPIDGLPAGAISLILSFMPLGKKLNTSSCSKASRSALQVGAAWAPIEHHTHRLLATVDRIAWVARVIANLSALTINVQAGRPSDAGLLRLLTLCSGALRALTIRCQSSAEWRRVVAALQAARRWPHLHTLEVEVLAQRSDAAVVDSDGSTEGVWLASTPALPSLRCLRLANVPVGPCRSLLEQCHAPQLNTLHFSRYGPSHIGEVDELLSVIAAAAVAASASGISASSSAGPTSRAGPWSLSGLHFDRCALPSCLSAPSWHGMLTNSAQLSVAWRAWLTGNVLRQYIPPEQSTARELRPNGGTGQIAAQAPPRARIRLFEIDRAQQGHAHAQFPNDWPAAGQYRPQDANDEAEVDDDDDDDAGLPTLSAHPIDFQELRWKAVQASSGASGGSSPPLSGAWSPGQTDHGSTGLADYSNGAWSGADQRDSGHGDTPPPWQGTSYGTGRWSPPVDSPRVQAGQVSAGTANSTASSSGRGLADPGPWLSAFLGDLHQSAVDSAAPSGGAHGSSTRAMDCWSCPSLAELTLSRAVCTPQQLAVALAIAAARFPSLKSLDLQWSAVTTTALRSLCRSLTDRGTGLTSLRLDYCNSASATGASAAGEGLTDETLASIIAEGTLGRELRCLSIVGCMGLGPRTLGAQSSCGRHLREVRASWSGVDTHGVLDVLTAPTTGPSLRLVEVRGCSKIPALESALLNAWPESQAELLAMHGRGAASAGAATDSSAFRSKCAVVV